MRARNVWIGAGIAVAAAVAVWLATRGSPEVPGISGERVREPAHPERHDEASTTGPRRMFPRTTRLRAGAPPEVAATAGAAELASGFEAETRDDAWAIELERELGRRLPEVAGTSGAQVGPVECRARACRFELAAPDEGALGAAVSRLEEPGGLVGIADALVIGAIERGDDGVRLTAYARFER